VRDTIVRDAVAAGLSSSEQPLSESGSGAHAYADAVQTYLAFALTRMADYNSAFATWIHKDSALRSTLAKQAIPMVWDFVEGSMPLVCCESLAKSRIKPEYLASQQRLRLV
jgi:putative DNA methylase